MDLLLDLLGLAAGIALLVWSADVFVGGSAAFARRCGMSSLLIGMVIIGFGTSMPEMLVSVLAAMEKSPSIALGNAYGSNTANIGLILGLTAALAPITVAKSALRRELPILLAITAAGYYLIYEGGVISRLDAVALLALFVAVLAFNIWTGRRQAEEESGEAPAAPVTLGRAILMILGGLAVLVASSRLLVVCAIGIARVLGVPDLVIGLTVVAVGTSLPELASSLAAIRKHEHDLALGNVIGSNLFNTLAVVGLACVLAPMTEGTEKEAVHTIVFRDYPVVCAMTLLLFVFCIPFRRGRPAAITRAKGVLLLAAYAAYLVWLVRDALR